MWTFLLCLLPLLFGIFALFCLMKAKPRITGFATSATIRRNFLRFIKDQQGQDLVEYALIVGFLAFAAGAIVPEIFKLIAGFLKSPESLTRMICGAGAAIVWSVILLRRHFKEEDY